eukprot:5662899-Prymnesium_polylepis.1
MVSSWLSALLARHAASSAATCFWSSSGSPLMRSLASVPPSALASAGAASRTLVEAGSITARAKRKV